MKVKKTRIQHSLLIHKRAQYGRLPESDTILQEMHVVISGLRPPTANFSTTADLRSFLIKPIFNSDKDRITCFLPQGGKLQTSLPSIRCEGSRRGRPRRNTTSDGSNKLDKVRRSDGDSSSNSSSQEEIIQLFKRIQHSISKETKKSKKRSPSSSEEKTSTESVLEDLQQHLPRKQARDKVSEQEFNALPGKRSVSENKERASETKVLPLQNKEREIEASLPQNRLPRPASNFVKRSPIRSVPLKTEENEDLVAEELPPNISDGSESPDIDKLKLHELKELAKSKGVKGFSKLKKKELVELLKGTSQPS